MLKGHQEVGHQRVGLWYQFVLSYCRNYFNQIIIV